MRTITIDDEAYQILRRLKQGKDDSFTRVIKRNYQKLDTCGELIDWIESEPPPRINRERLKEFKESRGKRSNRQF
jgi:predicted CopG family antitoxin